MSQISIVFRSSADPIDGIRDYTHLLASGLREEGAAARVALLGTSAVPLRSWDSDALLINYNPFSWGRWGWAPALPASLARLRAARSCPFIALMIHESAVPLKGFRQLLMGTWQRAQLAATLRVVDVAVVSVEPWVPVIRRWAGSRTPVHHLPVGSNVPDMRDARNDQRTELRLSSDSLVLAMFGGRHPSRPIEHLHQAIIATSNRYGRLVVLNLGADPPEFRGLNGGVELVTPGPLGPHELARLLSVADVFACPFVDGASARRTTLAAALQHGLPIVSTQGPLTDPFLQQSGALILAARNDARAFGEAVADLAEDSGRRLALSLRARRLFEERFDWRIIARGLLNLLAATGARRRRD
jgi:glycosyltransferase involved in cell wall biosynthesis